ncbi:MAG: YmdB family metallophosphoesterase [Candidatus Gastranaerophilales bacterium]|nr:YmdB family metallophosphoesterase [Candidatus Gastranaerophilales bacterium]
MSYTVLFFGDMVGRPGRMVLSTFLSKNPKRNLTVANAENASHGFGLTLKNHDEIINSGVDCLTSGNHIWDKKDIYQYIDESKALIRPYNYHKTARGVGYRIFDNNVLIINLLGKTFMQPVNCPFQAIEELANTIGFEDKTVIVDYHAEATAEKISFAKFAANLGVKAVIGTHTHVQTADERIIEGKCAYITDVGFNGAYESVIGMDYESSIKRLITSIPERFDVAESSLLQVNAVDIEFNDLNLPVNIKRINYVYEECKEGGS